MARLPDLVRDSQLDVKLCDGHTIYVNLESSLSSRQRAIPREETWKEGSQIGGGAFGSVWQEICIHGDRKGAVRAVKKISVRQEGLRDAVYMRELEAIAKFSHPKVWLLIPECLRSPDTDDATVV
jgi:calcium/calmodulin-dependent protein kinase I